MMSWWELMLKEKPLNYGRDTGTWNRAKIIGVVDAFSAIAAIYGEQFALQIMMAIPAQTILDIVNVDSTADKITIREG